VFNDYSTKAFGDKFREYKQFYCKLCAASIRTITNTLLTADARGAGPSGITARNTEEIGLESDTKDGITGASAGLEILMGRFSFHPLYLCAKWLDKEQGFKERCTVAVSVPSGLKSEDITVGLDDSGSTMVLDYNWPLPLVNPEALCGHYIKDRQNKNYTANYPEVTAQDPVVSTANILLPFSVEKKGFEKVLVPCKSNQTQSDTTKTLLVRFTKLEEHSELEDKSKHPTELS